MGLFCPPLVQNSMQPLSFQLDSQSPGQENPCKGANFFLSDNLIHLSNFLVKTDNLPETETYLLQQCPPIFEDSNVYNSLQDEQVHELIERAVKEKRESHCKGGGDFEDGMAVLSQELKESLEIGKEVSEDGQGYLKEFLWSTTRFFEPDWLPFMEEYLSHLLPVDLIAKKSYRSWFRLLKNSTHPLESKYNCRLCSDLYSKFKYKKSSENKLAAKEGIMKESARLNRRTIIQHDRLDHHRMIIQDLMMKEGKWRENNFFQLQQHEDEKEGGIYGPTNRLFRTVIAGNKANLPFNGMKWILDLQDSNSVNLGDSFRNHRSLAKITSFISGQMHRTLVTHLVQKSNPISIMIDAATDTQQKHFLIVLLQTFAEFRPVTYFYRILEVEDESAKGLTDLILNAFREDGQLFFSSIMENLVGFSSDGAAVMTSHRNGVYAKLNSSTVHNLYPVHCMAHKIHLVGRHTISLFKETEVLEETLSHVHSFYRRYGHKRLASLERTAKKFDLPLFKTNYVYKARWIASEVTSVKNLARSWVALVRDLEEISGNQEFTQSTREKAEELRSQLVKPGFLISMHFLLDIFSQLKYLSERFQRRHGVLVGIADVIRQAQMSFSALGQEDGPALESFYSDLRCSDMPLVAQNPHLTTACNESMLYLSKYATWKGVDIDPEYDEMYMRIAEFRERFVLHLMNQFSNYFPEDDFELFEVLNPEEISRQVHKDEYFGNQEIRTLAKRFEVNEAGALQGWDAAKEEFKFGGWFCHVKEDPPREFWSFYLGRFEDLGDLKLLIMKILAIPVASSDAERAFSIMGNIKGKQRCTS